MIMYAALPSGHSEFYRSNSQTHEHYIKWEADEIVMPADRNWNLDLEIDNRILKVHCQQYERFITIAVYSGLLL